PAQNSRAASSSVNVPTTLLWMNPSGPRIDRSTWDSAAKCTIVSTSCSLSSVSTSARSRTSPCTKTCRPGSGRSRRFSRLPAYVSRSRFTTRTSSHRPSRNRTKFEPMKPAPPVTSTLRMGAPSKGSPTGRAGRSGVDFRRLERRAAPVFLGKDRRLPRRDRPLDAERGVVPEQRTLGGRRIVVRGLVDDLRPVAHHVEPVGEAGRDPELAPVRRGQRRAQPLPEGRGVATEVDDDVEYLPDHDPHQLALRLPDLVVQAAERAPPGAGLVVLHERRRDPGFREPPRLEGLHEIAPRVLVDLRLDQDHAGDGSVGEGHGPPGVRRMCEWEHVARQRGRVEYTRRSEGAQDNGPGGQ